VAKLVAAAGARAGRGQLLRGWGALERNRWGEQARALAAAHEAVEVERDFLQEEVRRMQLWRGLTILAGCVGKRDRAMLARAWGEIRQEGLSRAVLTRAVAALLHSHRWQLRGAFHRLQLAGAEAMARRTHALTARATLGRALVARSRRKWLAPAWRGWKALVQDQQEEEEWFERREGVRLRAAVLIARVTDGRDRLRLQRGVAAWRLAMERARAAEVWREAEKTRREVEEWAEAAAGAGAQVALVSAQAAHHTRQLGARLLLHWARRWRSQRLLCSLRLWRAVTEASASQERALRRCLSCWRRRGLSQAFRGLREASMACAADRERIWRQTRAVSLGASRARRRRLRGAWAAWIFWARERQSARGALGHGARALERILHRHKGGGALRRSFGAWVEAARAEAEERERAKGRERRCQHLVAVVLRVGEGGRLRAKVRALGLWRLHAAAAAFQDGSHELRASRKEAGVRQMASTAGRALQRRQARAWARLLSSGAAASAAREQERARGKRQGRALGALCARLSRSLLGKALGTWKHATVESRLREALGTLQGERGAAALGAVVGRALWRSQLRAFRQLRSVVSAGARVEQGARAVVAILSREQTRRREALLVWGLWAWRVKAAEELRAEAEQRRKGTELVLRARALVGLLLKRRRRLLEVAFEAVVAYGAWAIYHSARNQSRLQRVEVGSRVLERVGSRRWAARRGAAFVAWRSLALDRGSWAQVLQRLDRHWRRRLLSQGFQAIVARGAWGIYDSKEAEGLSYRLWAGARLVQRALSRRLAMRAVGVLAHWRHLVAEAGIEDGGQRLLQAKRESGARLMARALSRVATTKCSRAWACWRASAAWAAAEEGMRMIGDLRLSDTCRRAGATLMARALWAGRRRALGNALRTWRTETRAAADAELQSLEMHFHVASTVLRVERRSYAARVARTWRLWAALTCEARYEDQRLAKGGLRLTQAMTRALEGARRQTLLRAWRAWVRKVAQDGSRRLMGARFGLLASPGRPKSKKSMSPPSSTPAPAPAPAPAPVLMGSVAGTTHTAQPPPSLGATSAEKALQARRHSSEDKGREMGNGEEEKNKQAPTGMTKAGAGSGLRLKPVAPQIPVVTWNQDERDTGVAASPPGVAATAGVPGTGTGAGDWAGDWAGACLPPNSPPPEQLLARDRLLQGTQSSLRVQQRLKGGNHGAAGSAASPSPRVIPCMQQSPQQGEVVESLWATESWEAGQGEGSLDLSASSEEGFRSFSVGA
ncbi:unnamed protein product, partial [Discosporangium mesarthrocarpum]